MMAARQESVQIVREGEIRYSRPIERALLRDPRITWGAKGVFSFLWDCPIDWVPNVSHLTKLGPDGRDATRSRLRELEAVGAMRREPLIGVDGKLSGSRWILRAPRLWAQEAPLGGTEGRVSRRSGNPNFGKSVAKVHQSEESTKKEEEQSAGTVVDKLRSIGVIVQNAEDIKNGERLVADLGGRFDLIRNAVAVVRERKEKNRPFVSTVARTALSMLGDERQKDLIEKSTARTNLQIISQGKPSLPIGGRLRQLR